MLITMLLDIIKIETNSKKYNLRDSKCSTTMGIINEFAYGESFSRVDIYVEE